MSVTSPAYLAWLATVEVGTLIPFSRPALGGTYWSLRPITRITPKFIFVGDDRFDRATGDGRSDGTRFLQLRPVTDGIRAEMAERKTRDAALTRILAESDTQFRNVSTAKLTAIAAILNDGA